MRGSRWFVPIVVSAALGCSTHLYGEVMRGVDLEARQPVHVVRHSKDERHLDRIIARRLARSGFAATSAAAGRGVPEGVQALVSYEDHWMWDMEMYLLVLRIDFRDPETNELLASGQSYRTSGARQSPEFMVDEILGAILSGAAR